MIVATIGSNAGKIVPHATPVRLLASNIAPTAGRTAANIARIGARTSASCAAKTDGIANRNSL